MKTNLSIDLSAWKGIMVYLEYQKGVLSPISFELLGEAYRLAEQCNQPIFAVAIGEGVNCLVQQLQGYTIDSVYLYELAGGFRADAYLVAMSKAISKCKPSIVLMGGTNEGRSLASRLAVYFGTGLTADCTELAIGVDGNLIQTRPAFGGNIMASIITKDSRPQFVTLREHVKQAILPDSTSFIINSTNIFNELIENCQSPITILQTEILEDSDNICDADLLIVAGRGVSKKEDLNKLREMAEILGGKLAGSRALVEKGWMTPKEQIGLSGNTVSPNCMITFGVSGTVQFVAGMKQTKNIIAVNSDPNARIFHIAHYPICADITEVIPKLLELIKEGSHDIPVMQQ